MITGGYDNSVFSDEGMRRDRMGLEMFTQTCTGHAYCCCYCTVGQVVLCIVCFFNNKIIICFLISKLRMWLLQANWKRKIFHHLKLCQWRLERLYVYCSSERSMDNMVFGLNVLYTIPSFHGNNCQCVCFSPLHIRFGSGAGSSEWCKQEIRRTQSYGNNSLSAHQH